jgi:energy-coupling factor transporter ATP-binding protein EcfA2
MPEEIKIGIWGGSGSGKTTYLSALRIAALNDQSGRWVIDGLDPLSARFLSDGTRLLRRGTFPPPTEAASAARYSYEVRGNLTAGLLDRLRYKVGSPRYVNFKLDVFDYPGGLLLTADAGDELWQYLADCQGLLYLYDPQMTDIETDNFECLQQSLDMIRQVYVRNNQSPYYRGKLPQHLAVCITKFDDDSVFTQLMRHNLIAQDPDDPIHAPYVLDSTKAFECFADPLTLATIQGYFQEDRVKYFATSSIGFNVDSETGKVDVERCNNTVTELLATTINGQQTIIKQVRIVGRVNPINVLDPLLWLHAKLTGGNARNAA